MWCRSEDEVWPAGNVLPGNAAVRASAALDITGDTVTPEINGFHHFWGIRVVLSGICLSGVRAALA